MATFVVWRNQVTKQSPGECVFLLKPILEPRVRADVPRLLGQHPAPCFTAPDAASCPHPGGFFRAHPSRRMVCLRTRHVPDKCLPLVGQMASVHPRDQDATRTCERSSRQNRRASRHSQLASSRARLPRLPLSGRRLPKPLPGSPLLLKSPRDPASPSPNRGCHHPERGRFDIVTHPGASRAFLQQHETTIHPRITATSASPAT